MIYKDYSPQAIVARKRYKRKLKIARVKQTLKELCIMTLFVFIVATNWVDVLLDYVGL